MNIQQYLSEIKTSIDNIPSMSIEYSESTLPDVQNLTAVDLLVKTHPTNPDLIKSIYEKLIAFKIFGCQPITSPTSLVYRFEIATRSDDPLSITMELKKYVASATHQLTITGDIVEFIDQQFVLPIINQIMQAGNTTTINSLGNLPVIVNMLSNEIAASTRRGAGNVIVCDYEIAEFLNGKVPHNIYIRNEIGNNILIGYKGNGASSAYIECDAGVILAPYVLYSNDADEPYCQIANVICDLNYYRVIQIA